MYFHHKRWLHIFKVSFNSEIISRWNVDFVVDQIFLNGYRSNSSRFFLKKNTIRKLLINCGHSQIFGNDCRYICAIIEHLLSKIEMHSFIIFKNGYFVITFFCNINTKSSNTKKSTKTTKHSHTRLQRSNSKICNPKLKLGVVTMSSSFCFYFAPKKIQLAHEQYWLYHCQNMFKMYQTEIVSRCGLFGMKLTPITWLNKNEEEKNRIINCLK